MALTIENREIEELAAEVAELAHETQTEAIRRSLLDRKLCTQPSELIGDSAAAVDTAPT